MSFFHFLKPKRVTVPPPKRKPLLMHPDNTPRTMAVLPKDLCEYRYAGPTVEVVTSKNIRRPAFVARMIREHRSETETLVQEEMTASVKDLRDSGHADISEIGQSLRVYYKKYVPPEQQEKARPHFLPHTHPHEKNFAAAACEENIEQVADIQARLLQKIGASV